MPAQNATCPPDAALSDFGLGKLDAASAEAVSQHLETCGECRQRVAGLSGDSFVGRLRAAGGAAHGGAPRERTYVPGESLANAASSTDGSLIEEARLPLASGRREPPGRSTPGPSSVAAPPELANHTDYELVKELGQGGMGTVYLANNRMMDRPEVLKVISKSLLDRPGALERFQQEIRSAAKLAHPNIVAAYSVLRPGDLLVFAMEYVKGQDLSQVVNGRGPLPVANAAFYIHQVANGLQHAHEKGMVHRDIKPNNLMLTIEGRKHIVKILDFGLAKASSEKGAESGLTKSGQMLGTPDYVAPEQTLDAHKADIRADIYSLGCTLYFLLAGRPPFEEQSLYAILEAHHKREPKPLNLVRPDVPVELAGVVAKMMAKDPARRYQTPIEVARALVPFFKPGQSVPAQSATEAGQSPHTGETAVETGAATPSLPAAVSPIALPLPLAPRAVMPTPAAASAESVDHFSLSIDTERPAAARRKRPTERRGPRLPRLPRYGWAILAGLLPVAGLLLAGLIFSFKTSDGTVVVEVNVEKPEILIDGDRATVTWDDVGKRAEISLTAGSHEIELTKDGFKAYGKKVGIEKGGRVLISARLKSVKPVTEEPNALSQGDNAIQANGNVSGNAPPLAESPFDANQAHAHQGAWAKYLGVPVEQTNSVGMKLMLIPPGEFLMGSRQSDIQTAVSTDKDWWQRQFQSEGPQHLIKLTRPFYLGCCEVTQQQYQRVTGVNPSHFSSDGAGKDTVQGSDTTHYPVENVNWFDAIGFCNRLSEAEQLPPYYADDAEAVTIVGGSGYRLTTEAEWEYACRAGTTSQWSFGHNEGELAKHAWYLYHTTARYTTSPVGELPANAFGLHDMHGNVWELCWDWHGEYATGEVADPTGSSTGTARVQRGGGFGQGAFRCRSAVRIPVSPDGRENMRGFRVARTLAQLTTKPVAGEANGSRQANRIATETEDTVTSADRRTAVPDDKQPDKMEAEDADRESDSETEAPEADGVAGEEQSNQGTEKQRTSRGRGKPIDLLKQLNLKQPGTVGEWRIERGRLIFPQIDGATLPIPGAPPAEYKLTAVVECPSHAAYFGFGIVAGGSQALASVDGYQKQGSGLALIGGLQPKENVSWTSGSFIADGRPNVIECVVRKNGPKQYRVQISCNRQILVDWADDPAGLSLPPRMEGLQWPNSLFICMGKQSPFVVTKLTLTPLGAEVEKPSPKTRAQKTKRTSDKSDGWVPLFNGKDLTGWYEPEQNKGTWQVVDRKLVGRGGGASAQPAWLATKRRDFTDFELRLEMLRPPVRGQVIFRAPAEGGHPYGWDGYRVALINATTPTGQVIGAGAIGRAAGWPVGLYSAPAESAPLPTGRYIVEVHMSGKTITSYVEGTKVAEYEDSDNLYAAGQIRIYCGFDNELGFQKIEIKEQRP